MEHPGEFKYYAGGYIIETHGSSKGGNIDAIQLELPKSIRYDETKRIIIADKIAEVVKSFMILHYNL